LINISKRLETIAKIILSKESNKIIDVGCDHALLDIYLLQNNDNLKIIASDNKKQPLENARKNIEKYSFLDKIDISLREGIHNIPEQVDTIVISGMGAETIIDILENEIDELKHVKRLIISSNNKYYEIRKRISSFGYFINDEKIVYEEDKYYIVMEFIKGKSKYDEKELYFGPNLLNNKDDMFCRYYDYVKNKKMEVLNKLPDDNKNKEKIKSEIELLNEEV